MKWMVALFTLLGLVQSGLGEIHLNNFNQDWRFTRGDVEQGQSEDLDDSGWRVVTLPHDWSIEGPYDAKWASGTGFLPGGIGWYRKSFRLEEGQRDKVLRVCFEGVYKNAEVWINGHYLGRRPYGYVPFDYEITNFVHFGDQANILAVRVDHSDYADSRWYTGSGIYRRVSLKSYNKVHIAPDGVYVTTPRVTPEEAVVRVETEIVNRDDRDREVELKTALINGDTAKAGSEALILKAGEHKTVVKDYVIPEPTLWSISGDNSGGRGLSEIVTVLILSQDENLTIHDRADVVHTSFGIRSIRFDPDAGFFLNGENLKIKGVCVHHDGGPVGAAVPLCIWEDRLTQLRDIGCNAIRMAHNPPSVELLDLCDKMGFLVMDEAFDEFTPPKRKWVEGWNAGTPSYDGYGKDGFAEWSVRDIEAMVKRDRNHPSIILWSIGNEIDYANDPFTHPVLGNDYKSNQPPAEDLVKWGKPLVDAVKRLDKTRPVTAALANTPMSNAVGYADLLDVTGYNYQEKYYRQDHDTYPDRCILGSENSRNYPAWQAVVDNDFIAGQFLWVGFDFLGEAGAWPVKCSQAGLFDLCGFYKPAAWFRKSLWHDEPMIYLCTRPGQGGRRRGGLQEHWNWPEGQEMMVECYTNCPEVELFLNDQSLGAQTAGQKQEGVLTWRINWQPGTLKAVGRNTGQACEYQLRTAGPAKSIRLNLLPVCVEGNDYYVKGDYGVEITVVDENGIIVPDADHSIRLSVENGNLLAVGTGNPSSHEDHKGSDIQVWRGRGMAFVAVPHHALTGYVTIIMKAESPDLESAILKKNFGEAFF